MMQGDSYKIPIYLTDSEGNLITQSDVKDVEIFVGVCRKTLSDGSVVYYDSEKVFFVSVSQKETFMMRGDVSVQARILFLSGDVVGVDLGKLNFAEATSKVVLE
jgi:hypothetical protein